MSRRIRVLGLEAENKLRLQTLPTLEKAVEAAIAKVGYPGSTPELRETLEALARGQVRGPGPLPFSQQPGDKLILDELTGDVERLAKARKDVESLDGEHVAAETARAELPKPMATLLFMSIALLQLLVTTAFVASASYLLQISLDEYIVRPWAEGVAPGNTAYAADVAKQSAFFIAVAIHFGPSLAIIVTRGKLRRSAKTLMFASDIAFAGAFAAMRVASAVSAQAVAVSLIEFALLIMHTLVLLGFGHLYSEDKAHRPAFVIASAKMRGSWKRLRRREKGCADALKILYAHHRAVLGRELGARRVEGHAQLAAATVRVAHDVSAGALVAAQSAHSSGLTADALERHLQGRLARALGDDDVE